MIPEVAAWLIFLLPLASFLIIGLVIRPLANRRASLAGTVTIVAVAASFVLSLWALASVIGAGGRVPFSGLRWLEIGGFELIFGVLMDPLTAIMLVVVTAISLLVQIYSVGYMRDHHGHLDPGYARYFAYMSLFTAAMIGLVMAANVVQLFVFWELVGLGSYLLIGFWYHRPSAAAAAKKAFIITRLGDFGLLLAVLYLFFQQGAFAEHGLNALLIPDIYEAVETGLLTAGVAMWIAVGLFAGAIGKSAQFPLHTWLPDAMEGPTPVSALIHAATMVAAGVFLVARFFPVFELSNEALALVAVIGGFTAIFAASMALVMNDIKRVLAYSTVSQLGYMMLALGVEAYGAAIFHLFTHAFFKALLFLGSGSVNHATGTFDMRYMGGLRRVMPVTYLTFVIGSLSLAGIFPLSGFWSKDEILAHAFLRGDLVSQIVFWLALAAAFMTAFYMFRAVFMTFGGEFRGGAEAEPRAGAGAHAGEVHLSESPAVIALPLVALAVPAVIIGLLVNPVIDLGIIPAHWLTDFLSHGPVEIEIEDINIGIAVASSVAAVSGIVLAYLMYQAKVISPERVGAAFRPAYVLLSRKYYMDELYEDIVVTRFFYNGLTRALAWTDRAVIDRAVNATGWVGANLGGAIRQVQTGQLQSYGMVISIGILIIFGIFLFIR